LNPSSKLHPNTLSPGQNVELEPLAQNGQQFGHQQDPNAILNECREIDKGIDAIERNLDTIRMLQQRALDDPDSSQQSATNSQLDSMSSETMTMYRSFAARIKSLKQQPESGSPKNAPQLGKVDRKLKAAINQYQNVESDFRKKLQAQMARQYKIVRPDASEAEVSEAVENTSNQQVFSHALLQSDRRGQSRQAVSNVQNRHAAIQKIESQMIELAQLFQDMEALVVQQEDSVTMIEQKGEEVQENLDKGTEHIGTAIKSARSRNRKKWYCLGIVRTYYPDCSSIASETGFLTHYCSHHHHHHRRRRRRRQGRQRPPRQQQQNRQARRHVQHPRPPRPPPRRRRRLHRIPHRLPLERNNRQSRQRRRKEGSALDRLNIRILSQLDKHLVWTERYCTARLIPGPSHFIFRIHGVHLLELHSSFFFLS
jgi:t-SNARE complex subunit (syntaxin)